MSNKVHYICSYRGYDICKRDKEYLVGHMAKASLHFDFSCKHKHDCYAYIDSLYERDENYI